jgi:hypothetical protein
MFIIEYKTTFEILSYSLKMLGAIVGGYLLFEKISGSVLFKVFQIAVPKMISALNPQDETLKWYDIFRSANRSIYHWTVIIDFLTVIFTFSFFTGCWVFLGLKLTSVVNIPGAYILVWFGIVTIIYLVSAINQVCLKLVIINKIRYEKSALISYLVNHPTEILKSTVKYFFSNWITTPYTNLKVILTTLLSILLHFPSWIFRINIKQDRNRHVYYVTYALISIILGETISFLLIISG